jgi:glycosyltransferase A (GT-A) superfamily protein (DUF2064 family)
MKNPFPKLFKEIKWSTPYVLPKTLEKIKSANLKLELLDELIDVDTEKDLHNWINCCSDVNNPVYKFVSGYNRKLK